MAKTTAPFAGYLRISRVGGRAGASFISPDVQRETIARLAALHGLEVAEVVEELDVSGGKRAGERGLGRLVERVEAGELGGLLVWKVSRMSRSLLDGAQVADRIARAGGRIVGEDLDTAAPMGKAILGFLLGYAEEELDARRAGWRAAQERAAARGVHPTRTPVGFVRDAEGRLAPDARVAPVVAKIFRARARGASLQECADRLEDATGKGWSRSSVRQLFTSQTYLGRIAIGDGIYHEGAHPAIVDERTWQLAQREGVRPRHDGSLASQGVLAGLLRCAGCGNVLTVNASGPPGARIASYTCRKHRASGTCPAPASAAVSRVDAVVAPELERRAPQIDTGALQAAFEDARRALDGAMRELDEFLEAALLSELGAGLYAREVARRREAVREAVEALREADDARYAQALGGADFEEFEPGDDRRARLELAQRREFARQVIERVTLSKADERGRWHPVEERLEVVWKGGTHAGE